MEIGYSDDCGYICGNPGDRTTTTTTTATTIATIWVFVGKQTIEQPFSQVESQVEWQNN